ncbi:MAG: hypothetical protein RJB66_1307 [Pseudomonadota bacterium]|jgi:hypothetical protein
MKKQFLFFLASLSFFMTAHAQSQSSQLPYGELVGDALPVIGPIEFKVERGIPKTVVNSIKETLVEVNSRVGRELFVVKGVVAREEAPSPDELSTITLGSVQAGGVAVISTIPYYGAGEIAEVDLVINADVKDLAANPEVLKKTLRGQLMQLLEGME